MSETNAYCVGRVIKAIGRSLNATFTLPSAGNASRLSIDLDHALSGNALGPVIALQAVRIWHTMFPDSRGITIGARFTTVESSIFGIEVDWPIVGNDILSIYRLMVYTHAADQVLDWERSSHVQIERVVDRFEGMGAVIKDSKICVPSSEGFDEIEASIDQPVGEERLTPSRESANG